MAQRVVERGIHSLQVGDKEYALTASLHKKEINPDEVSDILYMEIRFCIKVYYFLHLIHIYNLTTFLIALCWQCSDGGLQ